MIAVSEPVATVIDELREALARLVATDERYAQAIAERVAAEDANRAARLEVNEIETQLVSLLRNEVTSC